MRFEHYSQRRFRVSARKASAYLAVFLIVLVVLTAGLSLLQVRAQETQEKPGGDSQSTKEVSPAEAAETVIRIMDQIRQGREKDPEFSSEDLSNEMASLGDQAIEQLEKEWRKEDDLMVKRAIIHTLSRIGTVKAVNTMANFYRQGNIQVSGPDEHARSFMRAWTYESLVEMICLRASAQRRDPASLVALKFLVEEYRADPESWNLAKGLGSCKRDVTRAVLVRVFLTGTNEQKVAAIQGMGKDSDNREVRRLMGQHFSALDKSVKLQVVNVALNFGDEEIAFALIAMLLSEKDNKTKADIISELGIERCMLAAPVLMSLTTDTNREVSAWACAALYQLELANEWERIGVMMEMIRSLTGSRPPEFLTAKGPAYRKKWWNYVCNIIYKEAKPPDNNEEKKIYDEAEGVANGLKLIGTQFHLLVAATGGEFSADARNILTTKIKNKLPENNADLPEWYISNRPYSRFLPDGTLEFDEVAAESKIPLERILRAAKTEKIDWFSLSQKEKKAFLERVRDKLSQPQDSTEEAWAAGCSSAMWNHIPNEQRDKWAKLSNEEKGKLVVEAEGKLLEQEAKRISGSP